MKNNGLTYIWIPSILTLNKVTETTASLINAVHTAIGKPLVTVGDTNPYYFDLNDLDMGGAPFTRDDEPGLAVCGPINNLAYLALDYATLIVLFGRTAAAQLSIGQGDIESFRVYFELTSLDATVPEAFPSRTYIDANQAEQVHTWATWGVSGASHQPIQYGTKWYRSAEYGPQGYILSASHWVDYRNAGGIVLTLAEFKAIQEANATPL